MFLLFVQIFGFVAFSGGSVIEGLQTVPPGVRYGVNSDAFDKILAPKTNVKNDDDFIWEQSGLYEGDIMYYSGQRNGVIDEESRWENATIPFYIREDTFSDDEITTILSAIKEFHDKTCLKFKPYKITDRNWVYVTGNEPGCWSSVGKQGDGGQQLNVNSPKCVRKGVVMHEFLHAAGFYHQQSASNRDEYVKIIWENISKGHESNFNKYDESTVTDYGISYDYLSVMHYSRRAFSKNGNDTIVALRNTTRLGQRDGLTESDILKLNKMYRDSCTSANLIISEHENINVIDWFKSLFD